MPAKTPKERIEALLKDKGLSDVRLGSDERLIPIFHSTGIAQLDEILGGGIPENKMIMLYGESSHGKTLIAQLISSQYQKEGRVVSLVDAEQSYDPRWWAATGVDPELLLVSQPDYGEDAVMKIVKLVGKVDLITIDSLSALIPLVEAEVDITKKATMGRHAQLISALYRKVLPVLKESGTSVITINQVRDNFENPYQVNLPGGRAQRFYSHVMIEVSRREWLKNGAGEKTGFVINLKVEKNKMGLPQRSVQLPVNFEGKFDYLTLLVSDSLDRGVVQNAGAYYRLPGELPIEEIPEGIRYKVMEDTSQHQVMGRDGLHKLLEANEQATKVLELMVYGTKAA